MALYVNINSQCQFQSMEEVFIEPCANNPLLQVNKTKEGHVAINVGANARSCMMTY